MLNSSFKKEKKKEVASQTAECYQSNIMLCEQTSPTSLPKIESISSYTASNDMKVLWGKPKSESEI